ncbi:hypothetical protein [Methanothrix soehngenii]|jgi:hypothetical protein|uniref:hypothetical protein n=1 Tax=Methanothrix soehngenii TaxID=2223 RepID=UPI003141BB45
MAEFMSLLFGIADGVTNVSATTVIALIALFFSGYNIYVHWKDKQPSMTVTVSKLVDTTYSLTNDLEMVIIITGYNNGQIPVNITNYRLCFPRFRYCFSFGKPYTTRVLPGVSCERWEYSDKIAKHLIPVLLDRTLTANVRGLCHAAALLLGIKNNSGLHNQYGTIKLIGCLVDDGQRWYKSKEFEFDIDEALKGTKYKRMWSPDEMGFNLPKGILQKFRYRVEKWRTRKYRPPI